MPRGEGIEERVRGDVVDLPEAALERRERRAEREELHRPLAHEIREHERAGDLGRQHVGRGRRRLERDDAAAGDARGVNDAVDRAEAREGRVARLAHGPGIGGVGRRGDHLRAGGFEGGDLFRRNTAARRQQKTRAVDAGQVIGERSADAAGRSGDPVRAAVLEPRRRGRAGTRAGERPREAFPVPISHDRSAVLRVQLTRESVGPERVDRRIARVEIDHAARDVRILLRNDERGAREERAHGGERLAEVDEPVDGEDDRHGRRDARVGQRLRDRHRHPERLRLEVASGTGRVVGEPAEPAHGRRRASFGGQFGEDAREVGAGIESPRELVGAAARERVGASRDDDRPSRRPQPAGEAIDGRVRAADDDRRAMSLRPAAWTGSRPGGDVEPVVDVRRSRRRRGGGRIDPVPLPLERRRRHQHTPAPLVPVVGGPVERHALQPEPCGRGGEDVPIGCRLVALAHRRDGRRARRGAGRLPRQAGERAAGTDLERHARAAGDQRVHAVGEADRLAEVTDPVGRVGRRLGGDPRAGDVRHVRERRRRQRDARDLGGERVEHRIHHRRMKGVRRLEPAARHAARLERGGQAVDRLARSGGDDRPRAVDGRERHVGGKQRREIRLARRHGEHRARLAAPASGGHARRRARAPTRAA